MDELTQTLAAGHGRYTIEGARWYGSVCNGPRHLVVQVEISGTIDHQLPTDTRWLDELRDEIQAAFAHRDWPPTCTISVEFDSVERLREAGWPCVGE